MAARRKTKKGPLTAQGINDFRFGIDRVERQGGKAFVVDGHGVYAPVEVVGDALPPDWEARIAKLSDAQAATMFEAVRLSPYLSPEGKWERMLALLNSGRVKLKFTVVAGPRGKKRVKVEHESSVWDVLDAAPVDR